MSVKENNEPSQPLDTWVSAVRIKPPRQPRPGRKHG